VALVALVSIKGAPGVTTTAVALGSVWPSARALVILEMDPAGGDIAARRGLSGDPSLVSLAAAVRRDRASDPTRLLDHCCELPGGLRVIAGSAAPTEMGTAIDVVGAALPHLALRDAVDVLVDCGRLNSTPTGSHDMPGSPPITSASLVSVLRSADLLLVLSRGDLAGLSHLEWWLPALRSVNKGLAVLLVGPLSWRTEEVAGVLGSPVIGHIPHDQPGADMVGSRALRGGAARLPLIRAVRGIADRVVAWLPILVTRDAEAHEQLAELDAVATADVRP
jgi:hypothetical protein